MRPGGQTDPSITQDRPGVGSSALDALSAELGTQKFKKVDSLLVLKNGDFIFEHYQNGYGPERVHDIASITKSVTSLLVGIAIDKGCISNVNESVVDFFSETRYAESWPGDKRSITIEHLLTMQHGIAFDDFSDPEMKQFQTWLNSKDRILHILQTPMDSEPGRTSTYCTASTQLLRQVIERSTGQSVEEFAKENLFDPLGIESFAWDRSAKHGIGMGFGADAYPRDLAVLGRMIEQRGAWNGKQIVSSKWLEQSFKPRGTLLGIDYGYMWYGEPYSIAGEDLESHLAMGHGGQFLILLPSLQAIIVITASDYDQQIDFYSFIRDFVIPICAS